MHDDLQDPLATFKMVISLAADLLENYTNRISDFRKIIDEITKTINSGESLDPKKVRYLAQLIDTVTSKDDRIAMDLEQLSRFADCPLPKTYGIFNKRPSLLHSALPKSARTIKPAVSVEQNKRSDQIELTGSHPRKSGDTVNKPVKKI